MQTHLDEEGKQKITYVSSDTIIFSENYSDPERKKFVLNFGPSRSTNTNTRSNRIKIEVTVPDRLPTDFVQILLFSTMTSVSAPMLWSSVKKTVLRMQNLTRQSSKVSAMQLGRKLRADYVVIIAGGTRRVLDVTDKFGALEREQNILADLPHAYGKAAKEVRFYKGSENDIKPVDREDLIAAIKKCHQTLWGGGRLSPPTAFGELCKLIFVKISDEQKPRKKG